MLVVTIIKSTIGCAVINLLCRQNRFINSIDLFQRLRNALSLVETGVNQAFILIKHRLNLPADVLRIFYCYRFNGRQRRYRIQKRLNLCRNFFIGQNSL